MGTHNSPDDEATFVTALLPGPLVKALDQFIQEEAPEKTRSDALRDAFKEWCVNRGYMAGVEKSDHSGR